MPLRGHSYATGGTWGTTDGSNLSAFSTCRENGSASATTSGTITVTFTYHPDNAQDTPPPSIWVMETAEAKWEYMDCPQLVGMPPGSGGQGNASIGDMPNNLPDPVDYGAAKKGSRIQKYDVSSSGTVSVSCSLSANAQVTATPNAGGQCSVVVSYDASIVAALKMQRDGHDITGDYAKCLPGELINLSVVGVGLDANSTYLWTADGDKFFSYDETKSDLHQLDTTIDYNAATFRYRYIRCGNLASNQKGISCDVTVSGQSITVQAELTAIQPSSAFGGVRGDANLTNALAPAVKLEPRGEPQGSRDNRTRRMDWQGSQVLPLSFGDGVYALVQIGNAKRFGNHSNVSYKLGDIPQGGTLGLDFGMPFTYAGWEFPVGHEIGFGEAGDSPDDGFSHLTKIDNQPSQTIMLDSLTIDDHFTTWMMFKSKQAGSCWVPLKKVVWS